jgi:hypothetical protein
MKRLGIAAFAAIATASVSQPSASAKDPCVIPKSWGRLVQIYPQTSGRVAFDAVVFEDEKGTLRATDVQQCGKKTDWEIVRE